MSTNFFFSKMKRKLERSKISKLPPLFCFPNKSLIIINLYHFTFTSSLQNTHNEKHKHFFIFPTKKKPYFDYSLFSIYCKQQQKILCIRIIQITYQKKKKKKNRVLLLSQKKRYYKY